MAIWIAVGGDQVPPDLAVRLDLGWAIAFGQVPCHRLEAARRIELLASVNHRPPAKPRRARIGGDMNYLVRATGLCAFGVGLDSHVRTSACPQA